MYYYIISILIVVAIFFVTPKWIFENTYYRIILIIIVISIKSLSYNYFKDDPLKNFDSNLSNDEKKQHVNELNTLMQ